LQERLERRCLTHLPLAALPALSALLGNIRVIAGIVIVILLLVII
jgi:hypothetical protein